MGVRFRRKSGIFSATRYFYALRHLTASIHRNETFCLIGESGSGKTTLIQTLLGFHPYHEGKILFDGNRVMDSERRKLRKRSQLVFQDPFASLSPFISIRESMEEPLKARGTSGTKRRKIVEKLAEQVGLAPELLSRKPSEASGGQLQRACIARALSTNPDILFLDEPLSALDRIIRQQVAELLFTIRKQHGMTFFLVTHDLGFVKRIGSTVSVLYLGRFIEQAPVASFFRNPRHMYSKALVSSALEPGLWDGERIILEGEIPSIHSPPSGCVFHPRCTDKLDRCAVVSPKGKEVDEGHVVYCHLY